MENNKRACTACGAINTAAAVECSTCGELLSPIVDDSSSVGIPQQTSQPATPPSQKQRSMGRNYMAMGILAIGLTFVLYVIAAPVEKPAPGAPAPPQGGNAATGEELPAGHPPTEQAASPQLLKLIDSLITVTKQNPNDPKVQLMLANAQYDAKLFGDAVPNYRDYLKTDPKNPDVRTDMATAMFELGLVDEAIAVLQQVAKEFDDHVNAAYNLAMFYISKRDRDSTRLWLQEVITTAPNSPQAERAKQVIEMLKSGHPPVGQSQGATK
ncbi:MAG: tetratricopeptide repeat protein [Armatimonadetes bacterium]|nr:tetratricopeptide repeat protein [Armatimonadota bacterium]